MLASVQRQLVARYERPRSTRSYRQASARRSATSSWSRSSRAERDQHGGEARVRRRVPRWYDSRRDRPRGRCRHGVLHAVEPDRATASGRRRHDSGGVEVRLTPLTRPRNRSGRSARLGAAGSATASDSRARAPWSATSTTPAAGPVVLKLLGKPVVFGVGRASEARRVSTAVRAGTQSREICLPARPGDGRHLRRRLCDRREFFEAVHLIVATADDRVCSFRGAERRLTGHMTVGQAPVDTGMREDQ